MNPSEIAKLLDEYSSKLAEIVEYILYKASKEEVDRLADELNIKMLPEAEAVLAKMGCEPFRRLLYACGLLSKLVFRAMSKVKMSREETASSIIAMLASVWSTFLEYIKRTAGEELARKIESLSFPELLELMFIEVLPQYCKES